MTPKARLAVFRTTLLARSECFIRHQGEALGDFDVHYFGARDAKSERLPEGRAFILGNEWCGRARDIWFKLTRDSLTLRQHLRELNPRVMLAHFGPDGALVLPTAAALNIPLVTYFHGFDASTLDEFARRSYFLHRRYISNRRELQTRGALFLAVSDFIKTKLLVQGYPEEKVRVAPIGVDTAYFAPSNSVARRPIVLFVGRFSPEKGAEEAIRVVHSLQANGLDVELVMLGDGPGRPAAQRLAQSIHCRCRFEGMVPSTQVLEWMRIARVLCVPSLTMASGESEGFGLVAAEAQACCLPVVAYATGGLPEAVVSGKGGFTVPCGSRETMAQAIHDLITDESLALRQGLEGRERVTKLYDLRHRSRELGRILLALAGPASGTAGKQVY